MTKIPSIVQIETSVPKRTATFKVSPDVDYEAELAKYAATNTHLAEYTIQ